MTSHDKGHVDKGHVVRLLIVRLKWKIWKTDVGDKGSSTDDDVTEKLQNNEEHVCNLAFH